MQNQTRNLPASDSQNIENDLANILDELRESNAVFDDDDAVIDDCCIMGGSDEKRPPSVILDEDDLLQGYMSDDASQPVKLEVPDQTTDR